MHKYLHRLVIINVIIIISSHSVYPQWERISDFQCLTFNALLADSANIWGGGLLGQVFKCDYTLSEFEYYQLEENLDIYSIWHWNDSNILFAGRNWTQQNGFLITLNPLSDSIECSISFPQEIYDIEFISNDTGFVVSFIGIHRTTDAGLSWEIIWDFQSIGAEYGELYSITVDTKGDIYASGRKRFTIEGSSTQGLVVKSIDRGETWNVIHEVPGGYLVNIDFRNNILYCHDKHYISIYLSEDFGSSWSTINIPLNDPTLRIADVLFLSQNHIFACVAQDFLLKSNRSSYTIDMLLDSPDKGITWYLQYENHPPFPPRDTTLKEIVYVSDTLIYCFGWNLALKTNNQGGQNNPILNLNKNPIPDKIKIYPIPSSDYLFVDGLTEENQFSIITLDGRTIKSNFTIINDKTKIDIKNLQPGVYIVKFQYDNTISHSHVFIKQ